LNSIKTFHSIAEVRLIYFYGEKNRNNSFHRYGAIRMYGFLAKPKFDKTCEPVHRNSRLWLHVADGKDESII